MQNTTGKLVERIVARKLAQDLERRNVLPSKQGGYRAGKKNPRKTQPDSHTMTTKDSRGGTNSGRGSRSGRCEPQSAIQGTGGTPCATWRQLDAHKMARSSTPLKKGCHATWKLDLHAQQLTMGLPQGSLLSLVLYNVYMRLGNWISMPNNWQWNFNKGPLCPWSSTMFTQSD